MAAMAVFVQNGCVSFTERWIQLDGSLPVQGSQTAGSQPDIPPGSKPDLIYANTRAKHQ
jgi:hypothetical protein